MIKKAILWIAALLPFTSCIKEDEYSNSREGNFEALWAIIDERYCFFKEAEEQFGLNWSAVYDKYKPMAQACENDAELFTTLGDMLKELRDGKEVEQPVYSYITCGRSQDETVTVKPADIIIVEGILIFTCSRLREQMDIKLFVDADDDDRVMRVISRDILERGKTVDWVIERYTKTVKPMYLQFIEPSKRYADIIIPQGGHNKVAIDIISATIEKALSKCERI